LATDIQSSQATGMEWEIFDFRVGKSPSVYAHMGTATIAFKAGPRGAGCCLMKGLRN
jgi:hypothetical protein